MSHECTSAIVFDIYKQTFERAYAQCRRNYGVFIHGQSLDAQVQVDGLNEFMRYVTQAYPDTFIVTLSQMVNYDKTPSAPSQWRDLYGGLTKNNRVEL
jgi:hypothetical protein